MNLLYQFYFPKKSNLVRFTAEQRDAVKAAIRKLRNKDFPHKWVKDVGNLEFYVDNGMTVENGVLGYTKFLDNKILISPLLSNDIAFKTSNGIYNNEYAISIIIHELTHREQMMWFGGLGWLFLNIPGINLLFIEPFARENESRALELLSELYNYDL
jgi:hypothetical protein